MGKHLYRAGMFNNAQWFAERFIFADNVEDVVKKIVEDVTRVTSEKNLLTEQKKLININRSLPEKTINMHVESYERNIKRYAKLIEDLAKVKTEDDLTLIPDFKHYRIEKLFPINA